MAETGGDRVVQVNASGTVTPFVTIQKPIDLVFKGTDLLVSTVTGIIWSVDPTGTPIPFAAGFGNVSGITLAPDSSVVVSFFHNNSIYRVANEETTHDTAIAAPGVGLGRVGQVVTHTFTIQNTGNGAGGFWLAAESEHDWPLSVQGGGFVGPVVCGQARLVRVAVTIPAGTGAGITDT
ncbi:MAG: hypothetical protein PHD58_03290, partial [Anaerolineales bacterium]|nr:hypothetical protein [Anaerolineales bacterium]